MIFVDSSYFIAVANREDRWHGHAKRLTPRLEREDLLTTDLVLSEAVTGVGSVLGGKAGKETYDVIADNCSIEVATRDRCASAITTFLHYDGTLSFADAVSLVNTFVGMAIDIESRAPRISNVTAGLSGPAIKPVALRMVHQTFGAVRIPIIGIGGIATAEDAIEFLIAGAWAVQVGTANFYAPDTALRVVEGIRDYCGRKKMHLEQLVGSLRTPESSPAGRGAL